MSTQRHSAVTDLHVQTFVGENYEYYRAKWQKSADNNNNPMSWNWAAFFLGVVWLVYRKMYNYALIFAGFIVLDMIIESFFPLPAAIGNMVNLMIALAFGFYGNFLYKLHMANKVNDIVATYPPDQVEAELRAQGGVNAPAAWGLGITLLLLVMLAVWMVLNAQG
jgi:hypothetical protein